MSKFLVTPILALILALIAASAQAFFDPPWITPENPLAGEGISVHVHGGECDYILEEPGYPSITREGSAVRIIFYGRHYEPGDPFCLDGAGTTVSPLGTYLPGNYTLTVDLVYPDPVFNTPTIYPIGVVSFTVRGSEQAVAVPAMGTLAALVLLAAVALVAVCKLRQRIGLLLALALVGAPLATRAQDTVGIQIMLSQAPGAPTPAEVVSWLKASPRTSKPPLDAFNVVTPLGGDYLIPDRATGDFLAWLNANANSARRKLEDCTIAVFALPDAPAALAALQADPHVVVAVLEPDYRFSAIDLIDFIVVPEEPLAGNDQYGWFDMNLDAAWRLAGGYALVGQIDMGLHEQHAALRQFNGGSYVGGNFVKAASKDVGLTGRPPQSGFDANSVDEKKAMWIEAGNCTSTGASLEPVYLGHGTHIAGLLGANGASGLGVQGTCKHCGIAMWRMAYLACSTTFTPPAVIPVENGNATDRSRGQLIDFGVQVLSMSLGSRLPTANFCSGNSNHAKCLAIEYAIGRDVVQVAASGNRREELNFPAQDERIVSAGGFQTGGVFWDDSPGGPTN